MTYREAHAMWKVQFYAPLVEEYGDKDLPRIRESWHLFKDWLHRDGDINDWQVQNWKQPPECKPDR